MPRKQRAPKRRRDPGALRDSVRRYLDTGRIEMQGDNPWLQLSLMEPAAHDARTHWQRGDETAARQCLARCAGRPGWFLADA